MLKAMQSHSLASLTRPIDFEVNYHIPHPGSDTANEIGMPDIQYTASTNPTMMGLRDHVLPNRCE